MNKLLVVWLDDRENQIFYYDEIFHRDNYILLISGGKEYTIPLFKVKYTEQL